MNITADEILIAQNGQKILKLRNSAKLVADNENIELSPSVMEVLRKTLAYIAQGKSVIITPEPTELTTQQAADFLKVSRPFIVKLLENNEIPFRKVGKHRRVRFEDLILYKQRIDQKRLKVLEKLAEQAQELNLGY
ncbi:MAG: helix-turn-helix domain-containing protein [Pyrinomonadaceae bacterium]|jgi:excisionase family DNA binding protein|nr:helix-turn-helix domain-containing protein [Pyrinomonadaceae bacterium]